MNGYKNDIGAVDEIGKMSITGNVIPMQWYKTITYENGKPDLNAIIILADIVYWFRPVEIRDEHSGAVIEMRKKFKSDKLQRSYSAFSELYGLTKNQVRAGMKKLCDLGIIEIEFRTVHSGDVVSNNVLYISLIPVQLKSVTYPIINDTLPNLNQIGVQFKSETNTETTTEITSENTAEEDLKTSAAAEIFTTYENEIGILSPVVRDNVIAAMEDYPHDWIIGAIKDAAKYNRRSWSYVEAILKRLKVEGVKSPDKRDKSKAEKRTVTVNFPFMKSSVEVEI